MSGAAIALFTANLHSPKDVTHRTTLQGVVYQLDAALQNSETQKAGLVFIYDMSSSKYSNFDYDLSQKILTLLKVSKLRKRRKRAVDGEKLVNFNFRRRHLWYLCGK